VCELCQSKAVFEVSSFRFLFGRPHFVCLLPSRCYLQTVDDKFKERVTLENVIEAYMGLINRVSKSAIHFEKFTIIIGHICSTWLPSMRFISWPAAPLIRVL
jgi:hypothetical protein